MRVRHGPTDLSWGIPLITSDLRRFTELFVLLVLPKTELVAEL